MSNSFEASNGFTVKIDSDGGMSVYTKKDLYTDGLRNDSLLAVQEYFQYTRDKVLGVWRNPERQNEIVYPLEVGRAIVLNETSGWTSTWERKQVENNAYVDHFGFDTAHAYFTAISKPWHEAKAGEIWEIGLLEDGPSACLVTKGDFVEITGLFEVAIDSSLIESGRRIWPADD